MYQTNSFDKLAATPYVSQYVGNSLEEQARSLERLQGRFDAGMAMENQMTRIVNSIPLDQEDAHLKPQLAEYYDAKLRGYAEDGDYHRMLPKIQNDAAMVESMYKSAQSEVERLKAQREAIDKTKAPTATKEMFKARMRQGESKFTPNGFQFGSISSRLPVDFIDVEKEAMARAEEVKKVSQSFGTYLTEAERTGALTALGIDPTEALMKELRSSETRDPAVVQAVLANAMANNSQWNEFLAQESETAVFGLGEKSVDALLSQKMPIESLAQLDLGSKKAILAQEVMAEKKQSIINMVRASKEGTFSFKIDQKIQAMPGASGGGPGGFKPFQPEGLNFTGNDKAFITPSWTMEGHVKSIVSSLQVLAGPNAPRGQAYALEDQDNKSKIATLKNVLTQFSNSDAKKDFVANGLALDVKAGGVGPDRYYEVIANQKAITEFYKAAKSAGIPGFEAIPMRASKTDGKTQVVDWDSAVTRILNNYDIAWSNQTGGDRKRTILAEATDNLFAKDDKLGGALNNFVRGGNKEVSTTVRTMQGGMYDNINKHYTDRVKSNSADYAIVSSGSLDGKPVFGATIDEYLGGLNKSKYKVADYEVRFLETNPLTDRPTYALVVPGVAGTPPLIQVIASGNPGQNAPDIVKSLEQHANKLEKKAITRNGFGDPDFKTEAERQEYVRARAEVVQSMYSSQLSQLNMFRAADNARDIQVIYPVPAEKAEGGYIKIIVDKTEDRDNSGTSDYIYTAHILKPGQTKTTALKIQGASPEELLYRIHQDVTNAPN
jgi:hypothetical protein